MRGLYPQKSGRARLGASLGFSVGISLCAGALIVGPLAHPALAVPGLTVDGDENGPQVQVLQPTNQDVLKGLSKILIAVKARKFNPQFVEMFVDDKPVAPGPIPLTEFPSTQFDWPTTFYPDGPHKLMVRVTDTQGFRGWAEVNIFINNQKKVDTTPPSLKWQNTESFQQLSGTASLQLDALDNFGVKWIFISVGKAGEPTKKLRSWMLNKPPYTVKFDTTEVPDGVYDLTAKAYDSFDQEGEAPSLKLGVVNSAVNATTVGDMLAGLKRIEESNQKPAAAPKPGRRFTVDAPENTSARATSGEARSGEARPNASTAVNGTPATKPVQSSPVRASAPATPKIATNAGIAKPRVIATPRAQVQKAAPSLSPMIVRNLPPASAKIAAAAQTAKPAASKVKTQVAKLAAPAVESVEETTEVAAPQFSNSANRVEAQRSVAGIKNEIGGAVSEDWRARFARVGAPDAGPRSENGGLTLSTDSAPSWSQEGGADALRLTTAAPLKVEIEGGGIAGRTSAPTLIARGEAGEKDASTPEISAPSTTPQTKISARAGISAKIEAIKVARAGKAAAPPINRIAALPRPTKNEARGAINAITVSPLQINVSDALPAFHVTERSSDLRAVAARYGLPVEVIAANNGWKADKTLVKGERIKLPTQLKVAYRGVPIGGDAPSMLVGGTGVTAFRFMFEQAGGKLTWDAKKQRVVARKGESEVVLSIGSKRAKVGDKDVMLELAAFLFEGRTMVPLRFFEEGLKAQVEWDPQTGRLVVAMAG